MKLPRQFYQPLAIGAPAPLRELPLRLERMIHVVPPHIETVAAKDPGMTVRYGL
jgi:malyl-CoA/(S)-citramalyl-CoA lyase